ncbi:hypothetical protein N8I77_009806 [Diaporthe amygdali]|uniref:Uncharacterized protein n=1 Tax=Phomopsis amygdali TaxID=1214568 RepID=A0AAD9SBX1_PHOAM|nr:hypothetical protein N8I77_009806 [Diaporthe amygdali]
MESQVQPKSIRWAPRLPSTAANDQSSGANVAGPAIVSSSSKSQIETRGKRNLLEYTTPSSSAIRKHHTDVPMEDFECAGQNRAKELPQAASLSESIWSAASTAPSTDTGSNHYTNTSSTSPATSIFQGQDLGDDSFTIETRQTTGLSSTVELIEICQGTFVAVTQEPGSEDKLQWRALSKRIHMAFAKTCRRYPNLSLQFKLAGASADRLQPVILFVCPPETQKQVRKFLKKQKWLSEAECGYKNMIVDGNFLRVALDGEGGLDGGLFIRADMGDVQTLCGKLGRLEGVLNPTGGGSRFTIGGVLVVNDTLCCLTTGHVLFNEPDTSEITVSDDEDESDDEEEQWRPADTDHPPPPSRILSGPEKIDEDSVEHSQAIQETRIGRLLTTSNWKRGVLTSNEDWSLIRLDDVDSTDEWIMNQFHYPGTEDQDSPKVTINKLARTEAEITETEVIILAGCTGFQKGRLNKTAVQLYLDNATFEAREIVTHEPLKMGDSGSWVVQGSKLIGHVFAVQDGTPWSYMIPIAQVIDDIQKSLLTYSIKLPATAKHPGVSLLCPGAGRSHASLVAFGVNVCPSCSQDLSLLENSQENDASPRGIYVEDQVWSGDDEGSVPWLGESYESSYSSDNSIKASTVPTSYTPVSRDAGPNNGPLSGNFVYRNSRSRAEAPTRMSGKVSYFELNAVLDEMQPPNVTLELMIKIDANVLFDFGNPTNYNLRTTKITLITPSLNNALRHVVRWDPSFSRRVRQIVLQEPYAVLIQHFSRLTAYYSELRSMQISEKSKLQDSGSGRHSTSTKHQNSPQHEDIKSLIDFTQRFIDAADVTTEYSRHERNACTFGKLWLLFYPGITVPSYGNGMPYFVHMWRLDYDGRFVNRQMYSVAINYFEGERDITALKVFPCEYLDRSDGGKTRRKLEEQGRRWYQLLRGGSTHYTGKLPATPDLYYDGPVFVDRGGIRDGLLELHNAMLLPFNDELHYVREKRKEIADSEYLDPTYPGFPWASYGPLDPENIEDLELPDDQAEGKGHRYLVCAPYLPGFLIKHKNWAWVDTAECLAEAEGKVLMTIHPGEIGSDAGRAKGLLSLWLRLAQIFDAVVLVPEADPYVARAPMADGGRSDVISVFWACLEVYRGVVILTTSRTGMFDAVALSQITLPIYYTQFDSETRQKIGMRLMQRAKEEDRSLELRNGALDLWDSTLREVKWNGHEIKSVLESALAMARNRHRVGREETRDYIKGSDDDTDRAVLAARDLEAVIQSKKGFEEYLTALHAPSDFRLVDEKRAFSRRDSFSR